MHQQRTANKNWNRVTGIIGSCVRRGISSFGNELYPLEGVLPRVLVGTELAEMEVAAVVSIILRNDERQCVMTYMRV
jgi:hypothetical protein